jgi:hypothetical protein
MQLDLCWDAVCFACFQEIPLSSGLLGSAPAGLRNAKETRATHMQKSEPASRKGRWERALLARNSATLAR